MRLLWKSRPKIRYNMRMNIGCTYLTDDIEWSQRCTTKIIINRLIDECRQKQERHKNC